MIPEPERASSESWVDADRAAALQRRLDEAIWRLGEETELREALQARLEELGEDTPDHELGELRDAVDAEWARAMEQVAGLRTATGEAMTALSDVEVALLGLSAETLETKVRRSKDEVTELETMVADMAAGLRVIRAQIDGLHAPDRRILKDQVQNLRTMAIAASAGTARALYQASALATMRGEIDRIGTRRP